MHGAAFVSTHTKGLQIHLQPLSTPTHPTPSYNGENHPTVGVLTWKEPMKYRIHIANIADNRPDITFVITDPADGLRVVNQSGNIRDFCIPIHNIPELKRELYFGVGTCRPCTGYRWFSDNPAITSYLARIKPHTVPEYPDPNAIEVLRAYDYSRYERGEVSLETLREEGKVGVLHPEPLTPTYENLADYLTFLNTQFYPYNQMLLTKMDS